MESVIKAQEMGSRAQKILDANQGILRVHSVFSHAVNFIDDGDYLVTVLPDCYGCGAQSVTVDTVYPLSRGLFPGKTVSFKSLFDLKEVRIVDLKLGGEGRHLNYTAIERNTKDLMDMLAVLDNLSAFSASILGRRTFCSSLVRERLPVLDAACIDRDGQKMAGALKGFIGLGQGLTPSGDDFICGFVSALFHTCYHMGMDSKWTGLMALDVLKGAEKKTTLISYNILRSALWGEVPKHMQSLLDAISGADDELLEMSLLRVLDMGSTSGADILCGTLYFLNLLSKIRGCPGWEGKNDG